MEGFAMKNRLTTHEQPEISPWIVTILAVWIFACSPAISAQGSRKDDIVFGPAGHPVSGATVRICQAAATGTPCSPLATIYTDATLAVSSANPFQTDGIGNYHFYAPAGRYMIQISGPNITGTITQSDVILPPDVSSTSSGNNISAFGLTLGGNLSVTGNANITGTLTTSNFSPGSFSPTSLNVQGNAAIQGPRPWIDVTSYGAKGNGTGSFGSDDTTPIQNAINAACAASGVDGSIPIVFFPPGVYWLSQTQLPSTNPVFLLPCYIEFQGSGFFPNLSSDVGFPIAAHGPVLFVENLGSSPNLAPVFQATYPSGGYGGNIVIKNLNIVGYNQAVYVTGSQQAILRDTCLIDYGTGTDATPLKVTDTFEFYMDGGCLDSAGSGQPVALFTGENQPGGPSSTGTVNIRNIVTTGGGFEYDQRTASVSAPPGLFNFQNIVMEASYGNAFNFICTGGNTYSFDGLTLDNVQQADNSVGTASLVNLNCSSLTMTGVKITHGLAGNGGNGKLVSVTAGTISGYNTDNCASNCVTGVVDSSGNPTGNGVQQAFSGGLDSVFDATDTFRLRTDFVGGGFASDSPSNRWFKKGSSIAGLGIDPLYGWLFADSTHFGFNASLNETTMGIINVNFASILPPTGLAGTAASGGSLASGTYTAVIRTTDLSNCSTQSAPSAQSAAVTLSGANHTINWTWTAPTGYVGTNSGYCLTLGTAYSNQYVNVPGASTTSYSMTAAPSAGGTNSLTNSLQAQHVFGSAGLSLNTTTVGLFNLDVQGSLGGRFLNTATPNVSNSFGAPACLASINCSSYIPISPIATDTFTRANSSASLGANWTVTNASGQGALGVNANQAVTESGTYSSVSSWNGQSFEADQWSQVTVGVAPTANIQSVGPTVRNGAVNSGNFYWYECAFTGGAGERTIAKTVSGTLTNLATTASGCNNGDLLRLEVVGNQITAFYNGALDLTVSDSSITSGGPGIGIYSSTTSPSASNWVGGNLEGNEAAPIFDRPNAWVQAQAFKAINTLTNCSSSASPAVCGSAAAGSVAIAASATTVVVNTTDVTANSQIIPVFDESLGTKLGITCNNASASESAQYFISARSPETSFTIKTSVAPTTNAACLSYTIQN